MIRLRPTLAILLVLAALVVSIIAVFIATRTPPDPSTANAPVIEEEIDAGRPPELVQFGAAMMRVNDYEAGVSCWMPTSMDSIFCLPMAQTRFRYPYGQQ